MIFLSHTGDIFLIFRNIYSSLKCRKIFYTRFEVFIRKTRCVIYAFTYLDIEHINLSSMSVK
jgi:hypothetical protein